MAEEKKPELNVDDWDSLPLDPDADDWDDEPPGERPAGPSSRPLSAEAGSSPDDHFDTPSAIHTSRPGDDFDPQPLQDDLAPPRPGPVSFDDFDAPPAGAAPDDFDAPPAGAAPDDFDAPPTGAAPDDFDAPPASPAPDDFDTPLPGQVSLDDFDVPLPNVAPAADFDPPAAPRKQPRAKPVPPDGLDSEASDFDAHLSAQGIDIDAAFDAITPKSQAPPAEPEAVPPTGESLTTKKVELDIDGIFLDDLEEPTLGLPADHEEEAQPAAAEPKGEAPAAEARPEAPAAGKARKKFPRKKLAIAIAMAGLAALLLGTFLAYKLFFAASPEPGPAPLVIDPRVSVHEPAPGDVALEPFYINFPGNFGETIVEMTVTLSYVDQPDKMVIEERMTRLRDLIFRITQSKGSQVVSSGEIQRALRQELADKINELLGGQRVSYVQINQIRILQ